MGNWYQFFTVCNLQSVKFAVQHGSLFPNEMIAKLEMTPSTAQQNKDQTENPSQNKESNNNQLINNRATTLERKLPKPPGRRRGLLAKSSPKVILDGKTLIIMILDSNVVMTILIKTNCKYAYKGSFYRTVTNFN